MRTSASRRPTRRSRTACGALLLALLAADAAAAAGTDVPTAAGGSLAPRHARFLDEVALLITDAERQAFLALARAFRRDAFIERFWRLRDPLPDTVRNELRTTWKERVDAARAWFDDQLGGARGRFLLTAGIPEHRLPIHCRGLTVPLEAWQYEAGTHGPDPLAVVFLRPNGLGAWRPWDVGDGIAALFVREDASDRAARLVAETEAFLAAGNRSRRLPVLATSVPAACPIGDLLAALAAIYDLRDLGPAVYQQSLAHASEPPAPPTAEWVSSLLLAAADPDAEAPALDAALRVRFPARRGVRTVVEPVVAVATAGLVPAVRDSATFVLVMVGEVLKDGTLLDSFRYRFELPASDADAAVPLVARRALRPGDYTLLLRVEDAIGGASWHVEQALTVPRAAARPAAGATGSPALDAALRAAESTHGAPPPAIAGSLELLLPAGEVLTGYLRFDARVTGPVDRVTFVLDSRTAVTRRKPPYSVELDLGPLPRARKLTATAYDAAGRVLARDERRLNAGPHRFAVRIVTPHPGATAERAVAVSVATDAPAGRRVERVELYLGDRLHATLFAPPYELRLPLATPGATAVVRALGVLDDGTTAEDATVINGPPAADTVSVDLVEVYATVVDRRDRPVAGLERAAFTVLEDGEPQTLRRFEPVFDLPVHATILLDTSASMAPRLDAARAAAVRFFDRAVRGPRDRLALIAFNDRPSVVAPATGDGDAFRTSLAGLHAARSTALFDSLIYALYYQGGLEGQRALLLISDGDDEVSRFSLDNVLEYAHRVPVTIYTVGIALGGEGSRRTLARLAAETGGRSFFVAEPAELDAVYGHILDELRARYLLVYQSASERAGFRRVEVRVAGRGLKARAMRGYHP